MTLREQLRALDPNVIDTATGYIASGEYTYSCNAIWAAAADLDKYVRDSYIVTYHRSTCVMGMKPIWWESNKDYSAARIQALEDFRDAIIVAKNPTILERIKAWLSAPCSYANFS
jgi:hypothetical protein